MEISLKCIIYFMTAGLSLLSVMGNKDRLVNILCDQTPVTQTAHDGGSVTIDCKYPKAEGSNIRHFCRKDENIHCTPLISSHTSEYTRKDRFSLTDDKQQGVYTVTISTLTLDDAGIYWCVMEGFENSSTACLTKIHLEILNWDDITPTVKTCVAGDTVIINCPYPDSHKTDEKVLCKGKNPFYCEKLIQTTEEDRDVVKGRYDIRDNKRRMYFYVNINNLRPADSGTYWCGSDRTWQHAEYTKVLLFVAKQTHVVGMCNWNPGQEWRTPPRMMKTTIQKAERHGKTKKSCKDKKVKAATVTGSDNNHPDPGDQESGMGQDFKPAKKDPDTGSKGGPDRPDQAGLIAGVVVGLALLLILVVVLIMCRHKLPRTLGCCAARGSSEQRTNAGHNAEGNHGDHDYEEIQLRNQQANSGGVLPSVYATVNPPADQLHYASVNFQKDSLCISTDGNALPDTNKNGSSTCDYSSISRAQGATRPPAAEQTLYLTVTQPGKP